MTNSFHVVTKALPCYPLFCEDCYLKVLFYKVLSVLCFSCLILAFSIVCWRMVSFPVVHMWYWTLQNPEVFSTQEKGQDVLQTTVQLFKDLIPILLFSFLFPLLGHLLLEGRLFHSTPCLIPHELCLFHMYITFDFYLSLSVSEFIQFRACNAFRQIKYITQEWLGLCLMCLPSSLRRWKVSIKLCSFCLISFFDLVFSLSLKAEWVSTQGLCNSLIIETIDHKGSLRAITSIEPMSQLCICTKSKQ